MKISEAIRRLTVIKEKFGDISITGGHMSDDIPLRDIIVTEKDGMEIFPFNSNGLDLNKVTVDGVFFE